MRTSQTCNSNTTKDVIDISKSYILDVNERGNSDLKITFKNDS